MMRIVLATALAFAATTAAAWNATFTVAGVDTYQINGSRNSIIADRNGNFLSGEVFAEGVDAGRTRCGNVGDFEVDYFFGGENVFSGHVLFTMVRTPQGYRVIDPTIFYDVYDQKGGIIETYANFDSIGLVVDRIACLPDGTLDLAVTYTGTLLSETGLGSERVRVSGTADAQMIFKDMSDY